MASTKRLHLFYGVTAAAGLAAPLAMLAVACIVADPPPELPKEPPHRPTILHGSVVPPLTQILATFPTEFVIPVELIDPTQSFAFNLFVDYDPTTQGGRLTGGFVTPGATNTDGGVVLLSFGVDPGLVTAFVDARTCHVIELVVANGFNPNSSHTPDSVGGDSVVWFYNPSGGPGGCPVVDAGLDGAFPAPTDAGPDGFIVPGNDGGSDGGDS